MRQTSVFPKVWKVWEPRQVARSRNSMRSQDGRTASDRSDDHSLPLQYVSFHEWTFMDILVARPTSDAPSAPCCGSCHQLHDHLLSLPCVEIPSPDSTYSAGSLLPRRPGWLIITASHHSTPVPRLRAAQGQILYPPRRNTSRTFPTEASGAATFRDHPNEYTLMKPYRHELVSLVRAGSSSLFQHPVGTPDFR